MKKRRKIPSQSVFNEESLHFRICHGCWHLNESSSEVMQCERCQRAFPSQFTHELLAAGEGLSLFSGLEPGNGLADEEEDEDPFEEDARLDDSTDYTDVGAVTGLSVRW